MSITGNPSPHSLLGRWQAHLLRKAIRALPGFLQGQARFQARYPAFKMGIGTYGMPHIHDWNEGSIVDIGAYCSIAANVEILLGGNHYTEWISTYPFPHFFNGSRRSLDYSYSKGNVTIGSDVWIGMGAMILSGVTIGHGAVIAARAVVAHDVPPYAIVAGNPAQVVRLRFDEHIRSTLLKAAWWHWPEAEVRQVAPLLASERMEEFLAYVRDRAEKTDHA